MSAATDNLRDNQTQLDADGCMVGVSRQALDEALAELETLRSSLLLARGRISEDRRTLNAMSDIFVRMAKTEEAQAPLLEARKVQDRCDAETFAIIDASLNYH